MIFSNDFIRFKNGDKTAFERIYSETKKQVFYVIYSIVRHYQNAEDLLDDVYVKLMKSPSDFANADNPRGYLFVVARNLSLNFIKHQNLFQFDDIDNHLDIKSEDSDFERINTPIIAMAKTLLAEDEFQIVMLCDIAGFKRREVANMLNLSTSGVSFKREKALKLLKAKLECEDYE
ncbi:MAG: RNA polymerase sigma factor [Clostridia bacterium]